MWVRSQDRKTLRDYDSFGISKFSELEYYPKSSKATSSICETEGMFVLGNGNIIGDYATEERAMEVLDEIQGIIQGDDKKVLKITGLDAEWIEPRVYEMPKE